MKPIEIEVTRQVKITGQDIDDILATAFDYSTYWCDEVIVDGEYLGEYASEQISRGGKLLVVPDEEEATELTLEKMVHGIELFFEKGYDIYGILQPNGKLDCCLVDGPSADIMFQLAIFEEVIYG